MQQRVLRAPFVDNRKEYMMGYFPTILIGLLVGLIIIDQISAYTSQRQSYLSKIWHWLKLSRKSKKITRTDEWRAENEEYFVGVVSGLLLWIVPILPVLLIITTTNAESDDWLETIDTSIDSIAFDAMIGIGGGLLLLVWLIALAAPIVPPLAKQLTYDADPKLKLTEPALALLTVIEPWQTKVRVRQGRFVSFIRGWENPKFTWWSPWSWYKCYCWTLGYRVIGFPGLQTLLTRNLRRLKMEKIIIGDGDEQRKATSYEPRKELTDHVRVRAFTFGFEASGAEIEKVPFTVRGSIQARIIPYKEYLTFFNSDSWDTLLTEAIDSIIPAVVRGSITLDDVIGQVSKDLWGTPAVDTEEKEEVVHTRVTAEILRRLRTFTYETGETDSDGNDIKVQKTLSELVALEVMSVNITNFVPELTPSEEQALRADVFGRQKGRGLDLSGQGQARQQEHILKVAKDAGETGHVSLQTEAFRRAAEDNNALGALLTAALQWVNQQNSGGKK